MRKVKTISVLILLVAISLPLSSLRAQGKESKSSPGFTLEQSKATLACYRHLDELLKNARMKNEIEEYRWKRLFESPDAQIVNEILPSNALNQPVNLDGYLDALTQYEQGGTMNTYQFRPYAIKLQSANAENFVFAVDVIKEVGMLAYEDNLFFRDEFDLRYIMVFDRASEEVLIRSISLNEEKGHFLRLAFPENLAGQSDLDVLVNGERTKRNLENGIMLTDLQDGEQLKVSPSSDELLGGFDQTLKKEYFEGNARYNGEVVQLKFRPKRFYLDLAYQIGNSNVVDQGISMDGTNSEATISHKHKEANLALDIGYRLLNVNDKFFMSLELGAQQRSITLASRSAGLYSSYSDNDPQFGSVERFSRSFGVEELADLSIISAGIGLNFAFKLHHLLELELGGAYNMGLSMAGTYQNEAFTNYFFRWNQANVFIYGDNPEYGTANMAETQGGGDLNIEAYNNINLQALLRLRISKRLWGELGLNYGMHNWTFQTAEEIILTKSLEPDQGAMESLKHLNGTIEGLNTIGYQIGIKYYL